jgi:hypothetical protein
MKEFLTIEAPELRFAGDATTGEFEAYAASFESVTPRFNERVLPGAFRRTLAAWNIHGQLVTEDYYFANLWRAHGGAVWIDPTIKLKHIGHHEFEADIATAAATRFTL